ncbi:hypothetical protein [Intestinimonas sp. HCP28S3_D6]|uniref:hypothetical protein n=1 Tax=Intestinimonas sp. HCP28S3_D6 TaxID=3438942 RepID=UPI003F8AEE10
MMEWRLSCWDGTVLLLPEPLEWEVEYTAGVPCDSFRLLCAWEPDVASGAEKAVTVTLTMDGSVYFKGIVDEVEHRIEGSGGYLEVSGRGIAALLLDNEAMPVDYLTATAEDILRDHVVPYGIQVGRVSELPVVSGFSVQSGQSEWQVLYQFACYYGGITPRFDRQGQLVIAPFSDGETLVLQGETAVTAIAWRVRRYGVLSEIWVRDRTRMAVEEVKNTGFAGQQIRRRQVMTMPGKSNYQAMRYSGDFQLRQSAKEFQRLTVTVPELFFAWPGDLLRMERPGWDCTGTWRVLEARVTAGADGGTTTLTLGEPGAAI